MFLSYSLVDRQRSNQHVQRERRRVERVGGLFYSFVFNHWVVSEQSDGGLSDDGAAIKRVWSCDSGFDQSFIAANQDVGLKSFFKTYVNHIIGARLKLPSHAC